ncbi:MAG: crosslink repair DNA glycosylase YcaQ family protein [Gemmatimonadota bacterium]|nr:crosslink repair DNA glycosylase YcaQ family protein [Gemmatimonadota bacterium]
MTRSAPRFEKQDVVRLWLHRQGLSSPRGTESLAPGTFVDHLERTGALQLDSVNAVDRAHYLTLWSRYGAFDRGDVDRWVYRDRIAYEYWGHEASILPISHLPIGLRRMRRFPPESWTSKSWWERFSTSTASTRRVLKRLREEGPLESADFEHQPAELGPDGTPAEAWLQKEDKRTLKLLWHDGRAAVTERRHFRCVYDIADRVYPEVDPASGVEYEDSWLLTALSGQGVASERHMVNYITGPALRAADRKRVIGRNVAKGRVVEVRVKGLRGAFYATPEALEEIGAAPPPAGTTLICPFDSLLWQRKRAEDLLGFEYSLEIYQPAEKRVYGYYVMPILHEGRLVGRIDPKLHRDRGVLEIRAIHTEPDFESSMGFVAGLGDAIESLAEFLGASDIDMPSGWMSQLG